MKAVTLAEKRPAFNGFVWMLEVASELRLKPYKDKDGIHVAFPASGEVPTLLLSPGDVG